MHQKLFPLLSATLLLLTASSCADDTEQSTSNDSSAAVISLSAMPSLQTRTTLSSGDAVQHVSQVQLYVFDGTAADATCVASEDTGWNPAGATQGLPTREQTYHIKYQGLQPNTTYTLIAVGNDDRSTTTYQPLTIGTKLSDARAATSSTATRDDIAHSELFGGHLTVTTNAKAGFDATIDLYRRVAGVMLNINSISSNYNGKAIGAIRVELYTQQNRSVSLADNNIASDPLTSNDNNENTHNKTIIDIPASEFKRADDNTSAVKGSYVLPIAAPADDTTPTMQLVILDTDGNETGRKNIKLASSITTADGTTTTADTTLYPLLPNQYYQIDATITGTDITAAIRAMGAWQEDIDINL